MFILSWSDVHCQYVGKNLILGRGLKSSPPSTAIIIHSSRRKEPNPRKGIEMKSTVNSYSVTPIVGKNLILGRGLKYSFFIFLLELSDLVGKNLILGRGLKLVNILMSSLLFAAVGKNLILGRGLKG